MTYPDASADPFYFPSENRRLFGWLHHPIGVVSAATALVICNPFGYEALCCHRAIRTLAEAAARLRFPVLRFDYSGTGDSEDIPANADQMALWSQDVASAVIEVKRRTGAQRICLMGIRLGALLAALRTEQTRHIDSLVLVAPVVNGSRYVQELRIAQRAASFGADPVRSAAPAAREAPRSNASGGMEVGGFVLYGETAISLQRTRLTSNHVAPVNRTLILDDASLPAARDFKGMDTGAGPKVEYVSLPGLLRMAIMPPHFASVSQPMIDAVIRWLVISTTNGAGDVQSVAPCPAPADPLPQTLTIPALAPDGSSMFITERCVSLSPHTRLFGIVTEPGGDAPPRGGVIFLNSGAVSHIGSNGTYVALARRWARAGYVTLRFDLSGIGDSATLPGSLSDNVFPASAIADIGLAIDFLRAHHLVDRVSLGGISSGGYHALRSAVAGLAVHKIFLVNPATYFLSKASVSRELRAALPPQGPKGWLDRFIVYRALRQVITGQFDSWRAIRLHMPGLITLGSRLRDVARRLRIHLPQDLGWELEEMTARGVKVVFVFAPGESGIDLLKLHAGASVTRLADRCKVFLVAGADHVFSKSGPRSIMEGILSDEILD